MDTQLDLPVIEEDSSERADAARNRERILCSARRLFAERGTACVSMDDIAADAGVGKGTLFRRFGSRAALAHALLSEDERELQEGFIRGKPPLGPGAPPRERLVAFGEARLEMLDKHSELLGSAELGPARYASAPYGVHRLHLQLLLGEADPSCDAELLAESLLATLSAEVFVYLRDVREVPLSRRKQAWAQLVKRLLPDDAPSGDRGR